MQKQVTKCSFLEKRNSPFCSLFLKNLIGLKRTNPATTTAYHLATLSWLNDVAMSDVSSSVTSRECIFQTPQQNNVIVHNW